MLKPSADSEQSASGQADMKVEKGQDRKVVAATQKELAGEWYAVEAITAITAEVTASILAEIHHKIAE